MTATKFCGTQTSAAQDSSAFNLKTLEETILMLRALPKNDQWLLVDPNGNLHKGDISAIAYVIMRNHPINRLNFDAFLKEK